MPRKGWKLGSILVLGGLVACGGSRSPTGPAPAPQSCPVSMTVQGFFVDSFGVCGIRVVLRNLTNQNLGTVYTSFEAYNSAGVQIGDGGAGCFGSLFANNSMTLECSFIRQNGSFIENCSEISYATDAGILISPLTSCPPSGVKFR